MSEHMRIIGSYDGPGMAFTRYHGLNGPHQTCTDHFEPAPAASSFVPYQVYKENKSRYSPPRRSHSGDFDKTIEDMLEHILSEQKRHQQELDTRLTNLKDELNTKVGDLAAKVRNMDDQITHLEDMVVANTRDLREKSKDIHAIKFDAKADFGAVEYLLEAVHGRISMLGEQLENIEARSKSDNEEIKEEGLKPVYKEIMGNIRAIDTLEVKLMETRYKIHKEVDDLDEALKEFNARKDTFKEVLNTNVETLENFVVLFAGGSNSAVPLTVMRIEEELGDSDRSTTKYTINSISFSTSYRVCGSNYGDADTSGT